MFAKVYSQIFDSSIAEDHEVRHCFMDLLVLSDQDGVVDMTTEAIARRTNVPIDLVRRCIGELCKPDSRSRSHEESGARIKLIDSHRDWGWQIINYAHYRELRDEESRRAYFRDNKRKQRAKAKAMSKMSTVVHKRPRASTVVTHTEAEAEAEADKKKGAFSSTDKVIANQELGRVLAKMKTIKSSYEQHQVWDGNDAVRFNELKARAAELRKGLGVLV